jgi:hypothetical protein
MEKFDPSGGGQGRVLPPKNRRGDTLAFHSSNISKFLSSHQQVKRLVQHVGLLILVEVVA